VAFNLTEDERSDFHQGWRDHESHCVRLTQISAPMAKDFANTTLAPSITLILYSLRGNPEGNQYDDGKFGGRKAGGL